MMKHGVTVLSGIIMAALLGACNNFFHDLVPPDGDRIISFEIDGQAGPARIGDSTVEVEVIKNTSLLSVLPRVSVSQGATLLPVTMDYVKAAFPNVDLVETAVKISGSSDLVNTITDLIKANPDFTIPVLDIPIDFLGPVTMLVISGQGAIRQYTVTVFEDSGEPRLLRFGFSKYDNAELLSDARCLINEQNKTAEADAVYPAEMDYLSYALVPSFEILGDSLIIDGEELASGVTAVPFAQALGTQTKTITVTRGGESKDYTLSVTFGEDPDSVRSITDFRFNRADNAGIAANAVASIINTDNTGTITVQVFYAGARPSALTPRFISPGTVSVAGKVQTSGETSRDFTSPVEYRVVSKNGQYTRTYTVRVELINLTDSAPRITLFRFSAALNAELVQDAEGQISEGLVIIDARYGGVNPPDTLIPEFRAEGLVTVYGSVQVSDSSAQDFFRQIKYTVTNPLNPLLTRDYWVQCRFARDTSSDAAITSFGFYPEDNSGLDDAVMGKIDKINGKITVYAPVGSGFTTRTMFPRFTAAGQLSVEGVPQSSGQSGQIFNAPVTYTVVSANGLNSRSYTVDVRELTSTMYVNQNAVGFGDGTSWENAFRYLQSACEAAAQFPEDAPKEIWIAAGTYRPKNIDDYFQLSANTSYIGGFEGNETSKSQRNTAENPVYISGDLGGGVYARHLFAAASNLEGDLSFENLCLTSVKGQQGAGMYAPMDSSSEMRIEDCRFEYLEASGAGGSIFVSGGALVVARSSFYACTNGTVYLRGTKAKISDLDFSTCMNGNAVRLDCTGETEITGVNVEYSYGTSFYLSGNGNKTLETLTLNSVGQCVDVRDTTGVVRINNLVMRNIAGNAVSLNGANGVKRLSSINGTNISGRAIDSTTSSGSFTLTGSTFDNAGVILINNTSGAVSLLNSEIKNSNGSNVLRLTASNTEIDKLTITGGRYDFDEVDDDWWLYDPSAIYLICSGKASVSNTTIDTFTYSYFYNGKYYEDHGTGIRTSGSGSFSLKNSSIKNVSRAVFNQGTIDLEIDRLDMEDIHGSGIYSNVSGDRNIKISNITASNISGYAIYHYSYGGKKVIIIKDLTLENTGGLSLSSYQDNSHPNYTYVDQTDSSVELSNIRMNNVTTTSDAAILARAKTVLIDRVDINRESYASDSNSRGINIEYANTVRISNSNIKNCGDTKWNVGAVHNSGTTSEYTVGEYGWEGGGIFIQCKGTAEISNTTIEDVEACLGGAIFYCFNNNLYFSQQLAGSGADSLTLRGVTIKNARAVYQPSESGYNSCGYGGGVYFGSYGKLNIIDTVMENCSSEVNNGAIATVSSNNTISGSQFIGCTSAGSVKVLETSRFGTSGYTITP
jgi:hypothetical protein